MIAYDSGPGRKWGMPHVRVWLDPDRIPGRWHLDIESMTEVGVWRRHVDMNKSFFGFWRALRKANEIGDTLWRKQVAAQSAEEIVLEGSAVLSFNTYQQSGSLTATSNSSNVVIHDG